MSGFIAYPSAPYAILCSYRDIRGFKSLTFSVEHLNDQNEPAVVVEVSNQEFGAGLDVTEAASDSKVGGNKVDRDQTYDAGYYIQQSGKRVGFNDLEIMLWGYDGCTYSGLVHSETGELMTCFPHEFSRLIVKIIKPKQEIIQVKVVCVTGPDRLYIAGMDPDRKIFIWIKAAEVRGKYHGSKGVASTVKLPDGRILPILGAQAEHSKDNRHIHIMANSGDNVLSRIASVDPPTLNGEEMYQALRFGVHPPSFFVPTTKNAEPAPEVCTGSSSS